MNQPPPTEKQTGKRIVSKGEYWKMVRIKCFLTLYCCWLGAFGLYCLKQMWQMTHGPLPTLMMCLFVLMVPTVCFLFYWLCRSLVEVKKIDHGVPLTRANTTDLPAPDSLVRASAEPVQEPQAVLLRAAAESVERHEEELVRASVGGTE